MTAERVESAYGARATEYIDAVGRMDHVAGADLALVGGWASGIEGPILDVGCGPGQWTHRLNAEGVEITGIDPTPEFIEHARIDYPHVRFRVGRADSLTVPTGSLGGILAWYSLIHEDSTGMDTAITEFSRAITPGGSLLVGFFTGEEHESFDHAVAAAFAWPVHLLASAIESSGFTVVHTSTRGISGTRTHGEIIAVRTHNS